MLPLALILEKVGDPCFDPDTMLWVLDVFKTSLLLITHSDTDCNFLLRVSVSSLDVGADVYSVQSSAHSIVKKKKLLYSNFSFL
jgi:hypothetical protein